MESAYPPQPPEGKLIEDAVKIDGRSVKQLAPLAGLSDARWRHIVKGYQPTGGGRFNEAKAPGQTLARMAHVLGLDPDQLDDAGRPDAARLLAGMQAAKERFGTTRSEIEAAQAAGVDLVPTIPTPRQLTGNLDEIELIYASKSMTAEEKLEAIRIVLRLRAQADAETAVASGTAHDATVETRPPVNSDS